MPMTFEKNADGTMKAVEVKSVEISYRLKTLRKQKKFLKDKLDAIQLLIDEAVKLGASEEV